MQDRARKDIYNAFCCLDRFLFKLLAGDIDGVMFPNSNVNVRLCIIMTELSNPHFKEAISKNTINH